MARILLNLGSLAGREGDFRGSMAQAQRAMEVYEHFGGPAHRGVAYGLGIMGEAQLELGAYDDAVVSFERAVWILEHGRTTEQVRIAAIRFGLARAGGDRARARALAEQAARLSSPDLGGLAADDGTLQDWLATHP